MRRVLFGIILAGLTSLVRGSSFEVPGLSKELSTLEDMFRLHRVAGPDTTLWDPWLPMSVLWLSTTNGPDTDALRTLYRDRLLAKRMDPDGYVSTQQHEGLAHSQGWPFPVWTQAGGIGWHFTVKGLPYGSENGVRPAGTVTNWLLDGIASVKLDADLGWKLRFGMANATLASPAFRVDSSVAPFLRVKGSSAGLGRDAVVSVDWQTEGNTNFPASQRMYFTLPEADSGTEDVDVPLYRHPQWHGRLTRFRLNFEHVIPGAELTLKRFFTAIDSRHNINNAAYLQACDDYLRWTGDLNFLRRNLQRMRLALAWALREFQIADEHLVHTPWIGHDGRSGHVVDAAGKRTLRPGVGVGNNYWDLLPFGGEDTLATIYYFDALRRMAALEQQIVKHPEWNVPAGALAFEPAELLELSQELQEKGNDHFWNDATGRFVGWRDFEGRSYDYGFTFLNTEAICMGFASTAHAQEIRGWIDGRRRVENDTSVGADIYHWRFGPRSTTRRNLETYFWGWSDPSRVPWGGQVQDGGAVLGFSYYDLMARLEVDGPDDAWKRLREIIAWFGEVQQAGGYRAYYAANSSRGTLQGGGTAGGLGMDREFFESVLVPQVMLYGFLGFHPRLDGCLIAPRLPTTWPSLTIRNIRLHDVDLDVTAEPRRVRVVVRGQPSRPLHLFTPGDDTSKVEIHDGLIEVNATK